MSVTLDVQYEVEAGPDEDDIRRWVEAVLAAERNVVDVELTVRIVGVDEIAELNQRYRHKTGPTNILSFPFEAPAGVELNLLGDLVMASHNMAEVERICDDVIIMRQGQIFDQDTPRRLIEKHGVQNLEQVFLDVVRRGTTNL